MYKRQIKNIGSLYQYIITTYKDYYYNQFSIVNVPTCQEKTMIENCVEPLGNHKCQVCKEGYYINDTFDACIVNPQEASFFRTDNITNCYLHNKTMVERNNEEVLNIECILCYENYYKAVNNRKCQKHTNRVTNCKVMSQSTDEECILCESGYYRKNDETTGEKCLARVDTNENCEKYHLLSEACETCVQTTYIKHYSEKYCSPPIDNCKYYETSGIVLSCKQCEFGFYFNTTTAQCLENDIFDPYCAYYNENKECQECYFGFFYDQLLSTPTCQPNTPEYVNKARCNEFHPLNKNECIGCSSSATTIKLQYTCKGFPTNITTREDAYNYISFCDKYEMTLTGAFKCKEPLAEIQDDNENNKKVYALITDEERAYDVTNRKIQYCDLHNRTYKTINDQLTCNTCYATREISTNFDYENVTNTINCGETETDSGYCVKYFSTINTCRTYTFYNIDKYNCPKFSQAENNHGGNTDEVRSRACPWYDQDEYTVNNCNVNSDTKNYRCYSLDDQDNCNVYYFFRDGMGVRFSENLEFEIVISPDTIKCLQYNTFELENNNNCIQASDDNLQCLLCAKNYYSIPTKTFTYELDSVESYICLLYTSPSPRD